MVSLPLLHGKSSMPGGGEQDGIQPYQHFLLKSSAYVTDSSQLKRKTLEECILSSQVYFGNPRPILDKICTTQINFTSAVFIA